MEISCRRLENLTILDMQGRWAIGLLEAEVVLLRSLVARLIAEGRVHIAVNLAALTSLDARGLGELVFTHKTLGAVGGSLALVAPNAAVRRMLAVTRLDKVLRLFASETDVTTASATYDCDHASTRKTR